MTCGLLCLAWVLFGPGTAHAGEPPRPTARLEVSRDPGAESCPQPDALAEAVSGRLGYEPFVAAPGRGDLLVRVQFTRDANGLAGVVEALDPLDPKATPKGERRVASKRGDCSEVAQAVTLTIAILLDPRSGLVPARPAEEKPEPTPFDPPAASTPPSPPAREAAEPPSPPSAAPAPLGVRIRAGGLASVGALPGPSAAVQVGVGLVKPRWAIDVELRADLPRDATATGGDARVTTGLLLGGLAPCLRGGLFEGCLVGEVGALRSDAPSGQPASESSLHVAVGPRFGAVVPLAGPVALNLHADVLLALTRTTVRIDGQEVWTTPLVSGLAGAAVEVHFP